MDDDDFKIPYIIYTIPNFLVGHQLPTQDKKYAWNFSINVEDIITTKGELEKLQHYHKKHGSSNVNMRLWMRNIYQGTHIE